MNKKITLEIEKQLIKKYLSGLTLLQTGKLFNLSGFTVRQCLIRANIKPRDLSESHKGHIPYNKGIRGEKPKCLVCGKQLSTYDSKYCREHFRTKEYCESIKKTLKGSHPKSEFRKGHKPTYTPFVKGHKIHFVKASTQARKNMSDAQKEYNINHPEALKRRLSFNSPNKSEIKLLSIINDLFPNEWKFVGDGSFIIDGKCPDYINCNGKKLIIELFGERWHEKSEEEPRKEIFKKFGYDTLIIWVKEFRKLEDLKSKIKEFSK